MARALPLRPTTSPATARSNPRTQPDALTAEQAAALLGISIRTLYAYVSRGLLASFAGDDGRTSLYRRDAVQRLLENRKRGRTMAGAAGATLNWGLPVLESRLTLIERGHLFYRGRPIARMAESASVEAVAALLWEAEAHEAFAAPSVMSPSFQADYVTQMRTMRRDRADARLPALVGWAANRFFEPDWRLERGHALRNAAALVRLVTSAMLAVPPSARPIDEQCRRAWKLDAAAADAVRVALVVCADHELNASSFTARCCASTGASLAACVVAGLMALTGPLHGGMTARVEAWWDRCEAARDPAALLREAVLRGEQPPGFGHPLYADGDPRAELLLERIQVPAKGRAMMRAMATLTGGKPNVDFALVALRRALSLPEGTAFGLFATARTIGWIAHALEQRESGRLIRPRAAYVGEWPAPPKHEGRVIRFR